MSGEASLRILFIDIDTLRPDHLGCYGYHRDTSPNIDRIAAQSVRFENCYAPTRPACRRARRCGAGASASIPA